MPGYKLPACGDLGTGKLRCQWQTRTAPGILGRQLRQNLTLRNLSLCPFFILTPGPDPDTVSSLHELSPYKLTHYIQRYRDAGHCPSL